MGSGSGIELGFEFELNRAADYPLICVDMVS
jgi:hypothetical protein